MNTSVQKRLLGTTTVVLVLFLALIGWVFDRSYRNSVIAGAEEQLRLVIYSLMGAVVEVDARLTVSQGLSEPRLAQPESGLYAKIASDLGENLWLSGSADTSAVEFLEEQLQPGAFVFREIRGQVPRFQLSYMVIWEDAEPEQVVFSAVTDQLPFRRAINQFRRSLGLGLGGATLVFIIAQLLALRWGLWPLRQMAQEVSELEAGRREALSQAYPRELQGLAENLDRFVAHEQRSRTRYRNALDDLAHSLKTPLAVVRNSLLEDRPDKLLLTEQLERMENSVMHQLSRASAQGPVVVARAVDIAQLTRRLVRALQTAYVERGADVELKCAEAATARGDEGDFMEILGNLLENAFKYCDSKVRISVKTLDDESGGVEVVVEDDGPGIPPVLREDVLRRGRRLDELEDGQGIGLAVVADLIKLYGGDLEIGSSALGGASIAVKLR